MDPQRWQRLQEIFHTASELSPQQRSSYLEEVCDDDDDLRREALSLIDGVTDEPFVERVIGRTLEDFVDRKQESSEGGQRLGPYRVVSTLGEGGMGAVYLAERADSEYRQQVAIKLVHAGPFRAQVQSRLRSERQILASLAHPNIAKLLYGGTTGDGVPYIVMEYIEGRPLIEYCDEERLTIGERLQIFRDICGAVHYAHQNLVVHRDLKPSNILVTDEGVPKLLDFGIAKILDPRHTTHTVALTQANLRLMTPEYASPEQVRGEGITTTSDVYALGVVLYELLSGHRPLRVSSQRPGDLYRIVMENDPKPPSVVAATPPELPAGEERRRDWPDPHTVAEARRTTSERLSRELSGDLDNIALMALRKEPERRYASALQLSDDIERCLKSVPVIAGKDTWGYRASKFVRRHRAGVATATLILMLVLGFGIAMWVQAVRIANERDLAELERARAEQVSSFLVDIFKISDPSEARGEEILARDILDRGAVKVRQELGQQPEVQAALMETIGRVYHSLGLYDPARTSLEDSLRMRRELFGDTHPTVAASLDSLAQTLQEKEEFDVAETMYRQALELYRSTYGETHESIAATLQHLGTLYLAVGRLQEAEAAYRESLGMFEQLLGSEEPRVSWVVNDLARLQLYRGDYESAERLYRRALAADRVTLGEDHPQVAVQLTNLAMSLRLQGRLQEAEPLYIESIDMMRRVLGEDHPDYVDALGNFGQFLQQKGDLDAAEARYREALAAQRRVRGEDHHFVAYEMVNLAGVLQRKGQLEDAEGYYRQALEIYRRSLPADHPFIASALTGLGDVELDRGELEAGRGYLEEALEIWMAASTGDDDVYVANTRSLLGKAYVMMNEPNLAEPLLTESYAVLEAKRGADDVRTQRTRMWMERLAERNP